MPTHIAHVIPSTFMTATCAFGTFPFVSIVLSPPPNPPFSPPPPPPCPLLPARVSPPGVKAAAASPLSSDMTFTQGSCAAGASIESDLESVVQSGVETELAPTQV